MLADTELPSVSGAPAQGLPGEAFGASSSTLPGYR
jgi:hypothetical protein